MTTVATLEDLAAAAAEAAAEEARAAAAAIRSDISTLVRRFADHELRENERLGEIRVEIGEARSDIARVHAALPALIGHVDTLRAQLEGDSKFPGLIARQAADDDAKAKALLIAKVGRIVVAPLLMVLLTGCGWLASEAWADYQGQHQAVAANYASIQVLKDRVDRIGSAIEENQRELLRVIGEIDR